MDRDLMMIIYGAVIGVGSSIVTTLFQHWLERREYERRRREEEKIKKISVHIPTTEEIEKFSDTNDKHLGGGLNRKLTFFTLLVCSFIFLTCLIAYFSYTNRQVSILIASIVIAFLIGYYFIWRYRMRKDD